MDAIWNKVTGKEEPHHDQPKPPVHSDVHPLPVVTEATTQTIPHKQEESGFSFAKMKDALTGGHSPGASKQPDLPAPVPVTHVEHKEPAKKDAWHKNFLDMLDHGVTNKPDAEAEKLRLEKEAVEKEVAAKEAEAKASVKGKLKGIFQSDAEEAAEHNRLVEEALKKRREAEEAKRKEHSFSAKIKDVFDDDSEEKERERKRLEEEAKRNQSFGARVRNIFDHHDTPPAAPEKRHLFSRTPSPPPPKDWKDKLTDLVGGSAKAEAKEDKLDKAIDFYQEHVQHKGDQKHEDLLEQAKDTQIANAIRHATGIGKDKDHH